METPLPLPSCVPLPAADAPRVCARFLPAFRVGALPVDSNLWLSPLAGYTSLSFRLTVREIGGLGLATTDLINARSLLERHRGALELVQTCVEDRPLAVQLFGAVPEEMREAAALLEATGVAAIDVNMGCPVRKVCQVGGGSALMTEWRRAASLVQGMVAAVRIPVTVKMRLGWDEAALTAPELAEALEDVGVAALTVHGRTRQQGFGGTVNLAGIRAVVQRVKRIPVVGNGDVTTPQAAQVMMAETGCAGVSIGRGAFYNPWIFAQTRQWLETGQKPPEPTFDERVRIMGRHLDRMVDAYGEARGCRMFRKVAPWYARRFGPASEFKKRVARFSTRTEFDELLADYRRWRLPFLDDRGELLPRYQAAPLRSSFLEPSAEAAAGAVAVPQGPVGLW